MDGSFIRAGSRSTENERAAVYFKHEWHNEDQLGLLIYLLLSGKGHESCSLGWYQCRKIAWFKKKKKLKGRVCILVKHLIQESHSEWQGLKKMKVKLWCMYKWGMHMDRLFSTSLWALCTRNMVLSHVPPPVSPSVIADYLHYRSTDKSTEFTGPRGRSERVQKLKWGMLKTTCGPDVMYKYG